MFKTKSSFVMLVTLVLMFGVYSFAGDIIYIVKRTLDERVAVLERKVALYDFYFKTIGVDVEKDFGARVRMVQDGCQRQDNGVVIVTTDQPSYQEPINPRNQGRYFVSFKDGSKMVIVTFEKTKVFSNDFDRGRSSHEVYTFYLENGRKTTCSIKDVDDIKFMPYNRGE